MTGSGSPHRRGGSSPWPTTSAPPTCATASPTAPSRRPPSWPRCSTCSPGPPCSTWVAGPAATWPPWPGGVRTWSGSTCRPASSRSPPGAPGPWATGKGRPATCGPTPAPCPCARVRSTPSSPCARAASASWPAPAPAPTAARRVGSMPRGSTCRPWPVIPTVTSSCRWPRRCGPAATWSLRLLRLLPGAPPRGPRHLRRRHRRQPRAHRDPLRDRCHRDADLWTACYTPRELRLLGERVGLEVRATGR